MSVPLVSVVTASLDNLEGLRSTADSIRSQTLGSVEHVVVDGGSSDGTVDWLSEQRSIRWISEPDEGISDALNKGVGMAKGEWILVLHAEDTLIDNHALERAAEHLATPAEVLSCDIVFVLDSHERRWTTRGLSPRVNFKATIPHQGAFCRRGLFERVGTFDKRFRIAMDYEFFLRAYRLGTVADVSHVVLSRMPNTGVSSRTDWASLRERFDEERRAHEIHRSSAWMGLVYGIYWPLYLTYRRIRHVMTAGLASR